MRPFPPLSRVAWKPNDGTADGMSQFQFKAYQLGKCFSRAELHSRK